jgi:hypothetical protein
VVYTPHLAESLILLRKYGNKNFLSSSHTLFDLNDKFFPISSSTMKPIQYLAGFIWIMTHNGIVACMPYELKRGWIKLQPPHTITPIFLMQMLPKRINKYLFLAKVSGANICPPLCPLLFPFIYLPSTMIHLTIVCTWNYF